MEFTDELMPLSEFPSTVEQIFLGEWNIQLYYEAMGLDCDAEVMDTKENDD
jgi:hypothetical protein